MTVPCPECPTLFDGFHECCNGPDRVEFQCSDCGEDICRTTHQADIKGLAPSRCASCVFERMEADGE